MDQNRNLTVAAPHPTQEVYTLYEWPLGRCVGTNCGFCTWALVTNLPGLPTFIRDGGASSRASL